VAVAVAVVLQPQQFAQLGVAVPVVFTRISMVSRYQMAPLQHREPLLTRAHLSPLALEHITCRLALAARVTPAVQRQVEGVVTEVLARLLDSFGLQVAVVAVELTAMTLVTREVQVAAVAQTLVRGQVVQAPRIKDTLAVMASGMIPQVVAVVPTR
jgi:hypothetical protein